MAKKNETKVEVSTKEILQRYWQGSNVKNLARWVKDIEGISGPKAREKVEQAIYSSLPKVGGAKQ